MSYRRIVLIAVAAGVVAGCAYLGTSWYCHQQAQQQMEHARSELRAVHAAATPEQRQAHARACFGISLPLMQEKDPISATAALFAVAVAPIAGVATDLSVPDVERVTKIPTDDLLLIARTLFDTGRVVPADQLLDLALSRQDRFRQDTLVLASAIRMDLGRDAEVLWYCDELIALDSSAASPYRIQAAVHRLHGRWDNYVQAIEKARERIPHEDPVLQVELIDGYIRIGRFDDAQREFDKLQAAHPELIPAAPTVHARLLIQKGNFEEANQILTEYLKSDPTDSEALVLKGQLLVAHIGDFQAAIETLQTALKHDPSAHDAHYQLGQTYARLNQMDLANHHLALHRKLLDAKVRMFTLEQQAGHERRNVAVRRELAKLYSEIQLPELAAFWERAADTAEAN